MFASTSNISIITVFYLNTFIKLYYMGNQFSSNNNSNDSNNLNELKPKSLGQLLDYIATHYILTMDFKSLRKLYDKEYCDKLVILTSDILQRYFTDLEITYLAQRIKDGKEINELAKDNVVFFNKDQLDRLDIQNSVKKETHLYLYC